MLEKSKLAQHSYEEDRTTRSIASLQVWRLSRHFSGNFLFLVLAPQGVLLLSRCDVFLDISLVQDPICVEIYQLNFSLALTDGLWCAYFMNPLCN
jgi:hypothetical protein